jgi:1-deoxy-D-xylulose 5-phosphate reductoisomerase
MGERRRIAIAGSIGTQATGLVQSSDSFEVVGISASSSSERLAEQAAALRAAAPLSFRTFALPATGAAAAAASAPVGPQSGLR